MPGEYSATVQTGTRVFILTVSGMLICLKILRNVATNSLEIESFDVRKG